MTIAEMNKTELAVVVSFRDDYIKWGRNEVSWLVDELVLAHKQEVTGRATLINFPELSFCFELTD